MGINVDQLVIISCILLRSSSSVTGKDFICENENALYYLCKPPEPYGEFTIPENVLKSAEFVKLKSDNINTTWLITKPFIFKASYLNTLHINMSKSWNISDSSSMDELKNELFAAPSLEILRIAYLKEYNRRLHNWSLTPNLMHLYLENSVMDFDLTTCNYLQSLSLVNAALTNIPENKGLYYLTHLDLRKNTLKNMTILDLANFCSLSELNIADAVIEECECRRMCKLFDDLKKNPLNGKFNVKYSCPRTRKNCSGFDWNWDGVEKMRDKCVKTVSSSVIRVTVISVIFVSIFLFIVIMTCMYVLRALNLESEKR